MPKKKTTGKSAKKLKYAQFSKVEDKPKMKTFDVSKEDRAEAEKSYNSALRLTNFLKVNQDRKTFKRFCKCCQKRTIFNRTKDDGVVCSRCGMKEGGESNPTFSTEKIGISKTFK